MGQVISEGLEHIGYINGKGYIFDTSGSCFARIEESGYISKLAGSGYYGKIDKDGTIRDSMSNVVGNIQANGYVYIHSRRICRIDSEYIRKITPDAWNYGHPDSYPNAKEESHHSAPERQTERHWPFSFGTTLKLIAGTALGISAIIGVGSELGFLGCLMAIPLGIAVVFIFCFMIKIFNGG